MPNKLEKDLKNRLLPGTNALCEVLKHCSEKLEKIFLEGGGESEKKQSEILSLAKKKEIAVERLGPEVFLTLLPSGNHQGVAGLLKVVGGERPEELIDKFIKDGSQLLLILDQIADPQNLGAIFRLAAAAGVHALLLTKDRSASVTPTVRRVSMGGTELVNWGEIANLQRAISHLKKNGIWVFGATSSENSQSIYDTDLPRPLALILGSEEKGLRRLTEKNCDALVHLPMGGSLESLNVSQAASVLVFEIMHQNRIANV